MASSSKISTSHLARVIEKPAIPFAPGTNETSAKMRNTIAHPIKSAINPGSLLDVSTIMASLDPLSIRYLPYR